MTLPSNRWLRRKAASIARKSDMAKYYDDPVGFCREQLHIEPTEAQREILEAAAASDRVAVRSGQKTGKTFCIAVLALWFLATRGPGARVVVLASTYHQLKKTLWKEVRAQASRAAKILGGPANPALDPGTGIHFADDRELYGLSPRDQEALAGISGPEILFLVDEASGFPDELFEVILGNSAGKAKIVATSNPTKTSGWFFDIFRRALSGWVRIRLNSEDTPNVKAGKRLIRGLATLEWVKELRELCGKRFADHPLYRVRVLGEFPDQSSLSVIRLSDVDAAKERWDERGHTLYRDHRLVVGVDVARYGDDSSVIQGRRGPHTYAPEAHANLDGPQLAAEVMRYIDRLKHLDEGIRPGSPRPLVNVDVIGVGASVYDALTPMHSIEVNAINVAERSDDAERWPRLRDQLWDAASDWLHEGGTLPADAHALESELLAPEYAIDPRGRKVVEPKEKTKKRLDGRSPDHGDAFVLCLYEGSRGASDGPVWIPALAG